MVLSLQTGGANEEQEEGKKKYTKKKEKNQLTPSLSLSTFFFTPEKQQQPHRTNKQTKIWTSEKEVLWVIANGKKLFGVQEVGEVFQTLSLADQSNDEKASKSSKKTSSSPALINEIVFPPGGSFVVNSGARARENFEKKGTVGSRVDFEFSGARLDVAKIEKGTGKCVPAFSLPLPPFGKGWFDTVVVGGDLRIARDVRGDTLICVRAEEGE